jgi:tryptophan halogenase
MKIVVVGGGTAGWATALITAARHSHHNITVVESSKIGIVGVGESTTGRMTDVLINYVADYGCDMNEFIAETGATLKMGIRHKGWTDNIDQSYVGPIDGSWTHNSIPDPLFSWGMDHLDHSKLLTVSQCGFWIDNKLSNYNRFTNDFPFPRHAMHVDAHRVGKYFKKLCLKRNNVSYVDSVIKNVNLDPITGNIKTLDLEDGQKIQGDFFIDCSGFHKILMNALQSKWVSYQKSLPLNSAIPFWLDYKENEEPDLCTLAWAQKNGWMWQIPLMDRKGCGYVFSDEFTTPEKAQDEIEQLLGNKIEVRKHIKFDAGRQEASWIKNCLAIGLSSAFLEPLEATSIHSTIVQAQWFANEFLKTTIEDTLNEGSRKIHNRKVATLYDDIKDFLVMHYMGGRSDSEFWKFIKSGETKTEAVKEILEMIKGKMPTTVDLPSYDGAAGWPLYSFVMAGLNLIPKGLGTKELHFNLKDHGPIKPITAQTYFDLQDRWLTASKELLTYKEFIQHFRNERYNNGFSDIKY